MIDKPAGITSHDVVNHVRRILGTKRVGHTGTLDPFATGVLVLLIGRATRLARFLDKDDKEYEAVVRFGFETDTGDRTGLRTTDCGLRNDEVAALLGRIDWDKTLAEFRGEIKQVPPMYSAKKVKGKKLYELARKGVEIERDPVTVTINELEIMDNTAISEDGPVIRLHVVCSAGTYIRTLAEDLGRATGIGAYLTELRRTRAGKFDLSPVVTLETLENIVSDNKLDDILITMNQAVSHLAEIKLGQNEVNRIKNGMKIFAKIENPPVPTVRMTDAQKNLVAIGYYDETEQSIQPHIVFVN